MLRDIENARKMVELLGDEGFVDALTNAEQLVAETEQTLDRVERIEGEAEQAVREANEALHAVDNRLEKVDETISLIEAKIEAGFSAGFLFFGVNMFLSGNVFIAAGLIFMGLLGTSSLVTTILKLPQVQRLRSMSRFATNRLDDIDDEQPSVDIDAPESRPSDDESGDSAAENESTEGDRSAGESAESTRSEDGESSESSERARDRRSGRDRRW
jgi:hypothetical protein